MTPRVRKGDLAHVIWHDAHGGDQGWGETGTGLPTVVVSVGHCIKRDKDGITLALSHDNGSDSYACYIFIPAGSVVKATRLAVVS